MTAATVLIVTFNSRAHFARLKACLEAQTTTFELLILDNASAPEERPLPADFPPHAKIIQSELNLGFAAANNRLAARAQTDFIALLNPDAFPEPDWLEQLLACAARHEHAAAIGSSQIMDSDDARYDGLGDCLFALGGTWRGGHGMPRAAFEPIEGEVFSACAAAALYRRAAWQEAEGFDEGFFCFGEDIDLGFRLRLRGWTCVQAPAAHVRHIGGASTPSGLGAFYAARNGVWLYAKSLPGLLYWPLLPGHFLLLALRCATSLFSENGRDYRRGVCAALASLPRTWAQRGTIQRTRTVSTAAFARVLTWSPLAMLRRRPKTISMN
ncbi:MAG: glycosyltransferase family 2 protein [Terricaulis sp.]